MSKKVSMQQIADRLGLSKYTVSQALSGKSGVSDKNRLRIEEAARAMGYQVKVTKSSFPDREAFTEAATEEDNPSRPPEITPYMLVWIQTMYQQDNTFWGKVLAGIATASKELRYDHLIVPVPHNTSYQLQIPAYVNQAHCIGHILTGKFPSLSIISLKQTGLPIVLIDHYEPLVDVDCVLNNNMDSGKIACQRLLALGCKRIVFIGDDSYAVSFKERWWGCRLAMEDIAGSMDEFSLKKWNIPYCQPSMIPSLERKVSTFHPNALPDGIICANDHIALELIPLLKRRDFEIPEQIRVIGLDNIDAAAYSHPPLSTIELAKEALGIRAVETLLYRRKHPGRQTEKIMLTSSFIARGSG
ncbi:LacI family transcriptional regulator [Paenibacillus sp. SYP-B3998]|uniref:LacI family transcriptional regulator n=1 Tax=Paenibacillus sp. SYP-B3998 TaxID=2678564 RepID=A0A6G4A1N9_9BACL|nr:LacI family DNA-binding transcriptional regulator [Paenibacillus sp. SYP-B3998]NEW08295.1 LacI family transcriptional regulator [Paenibacillus sp. SYP-B3998]